MIEITNTGLVAGDTFTIEGVALMVRNRDRRWWQIWKPRFVPSVELAQFRVSELFDARACLNEMIDRGVVAR